MKKICLLLFIACAFCSCTHYYYLPVTKNVPLFKQADEYRLNISSAGGESINSIDAQGAYSITNNIALIANYMNANGGKKNEESWAEGKYYDAGVGYYKPVFMKYVVEVFVGGGIGNQYHQYGTQLNQNNPSGPRIAKFSDLSFNKFYIQPSFGQNTKFFDIAYTPSLARVNFHDISHNLLNNYEDDIVEAIVKNKTTYLFESAVTIRFGWKYIKLQAQYQTVRQLSNTKLQFEDYNLSLGLMFSFAKWYK